MLLVDDWRSSIWGSGVVVDLDSYDDTMPWKEFVLGAAVIKLVVSTRRWRTWGCV